MHRQRAGVAETVRWLSTNVLPDLIFMDIHLSDDSAFAIFNQIEVNVPIVFTTAYDQYALDAFRVNSVRNITVWYDSRLLITLDNTTPERLFISKNRAAEFKQWMMSS